MSRRSPQATLFEPAALEGALATFATVKAKDEPLHSWFPYLEGYAPQFVDAVRTRYLPNATYIIDPFAGVGTTPLALAESGHSCGYCEVNPAMRFVIQTKLSVAALPRTRLTSLEHSLINLAVEIPRLILDSTPDERLADSYGDCFGRSVFFDDPALDTVLRLRTVLDVLAHQDEMIADIAAVGVMSQLLPASRLKRAGDVRYKTKSELAKGLPNITESVAGELRRMASHLSRIDRAADHSQLLTPNAQDLVHLPPADLADGVITSPPYLNGTNYIRNTKLELWFLRQITSGSGLRVLRDGVVTSGINDVTRGGEVDGMTSGIRQVVADVAANAYDDRIPRMISGYFADMAVVFKGLIAHTKPGASVCIDIGDSRYGGVHIPTQDLLVELGSELGLEHVETVRLRTRLSKDKTPLSQDLLVFRRDRDHSRTHGHQEDRWTWFTRTAPHQQAPYTKRNWGHPLHSACSYNGKLKPAIGHFLVDCFSSPGDTVLDPFSGAGTIPFEACLQGRRGIGLDISLMATAVSNAKLQPPNSRRLDSLLSDLDQWIRKYTVSDDEIEAASEVRFNKPVPDYFHEDTLREVIAARQFFNTSRDDSAEWSFAMAAMLHVLHGNRPYALSRRSHPVTPFAPSGPFEYRGVVDRIGKKITKGLQTPLPPEFVSGMCYQQDILDEWPLEDASVAAIITSPPFFDSTRFYMTNWMRFWFCGWERSDFDSATEAFIEKKQRESMSVYRPIFASCRRVLSPSGAIVFHLGASKKCDMGAELSALAEEYFAVDGVYNEDVGHCEKHGLSDKGTVKAHQYLVLRHK